MASSLTDAFSASRHCVSGNLCVINGRTSTRPPAIMLIARSQLIYVELLENRRSISLKSPISQSRFSSRPVNPIAATTFPRPTR
jgi:hypothetical protein